MLLAPGSEAPHPGPAHEQVAAGENHSAALAADGRVFTWGRGKYGQLGLGDFSSKQSPSPVKAIAGVPMVQVRGGPSAACGSKGLVDVLRVKPGAETRVAAALRQPLSCWHRDQICCGGDHVLALTRKGEVYSWGRGTWGQTGLGSTDNICLPRKIESLAGHRIQQASPAPPNAPPWPPLSALVPISPSSSATRVPLAPPSALQPGAADQSCKSSCCARALLLVQLLAIIMPPVEVVA